MLSHILGAELCFIEETLVMQIITNINQDQRYIYILYL